MKLMREILALGKCLGTWGSSEKKGKILNIPKTNPASMSSSDSMSARAASQRMLRTH